MKIHIGCGKIYKKGFVNIDAYDGTVADKIMLAHELDYDDNSIDEIECVHVIEHLGAARSIYALSEFYRVLKLGGYLVIETPDIEETFHLFLKSKATKRKYLMNWIYGLDTPGMAHRYTFPRELITHLLKTIGFSNISVKAVGSETIHPTLRIDCRKKAGVIFDLMSKFRRSLTDESAILIDNQVIALDQESILEKLYSIKVDDSFDALIQGISETAIQSPKMSRILLSAIVNERIGTKINIQSVYDIIHELEELDFPRILTHLVEQLPDEIESIENAFEMVFEMGRKSLKKLMQSQTHDEILKQLEETESSISPQIQVPLFSIQSLKTLAEMFLANGIKAFALDDFEDASRHLGTAQKLDRSNPLISWNLARVSSILGDTRRSKKYYSLLQRQVIEQKSLKRIRAEMTAIDSGQIDDIQEPVYRIHQ